MQFKSLRTKLIFIFGLCLVAAVLVLLASGLWATGQTKNIILESTTTGAVNTVKQLLVSKAEIVELGVSIQFAKALDSARTMADALAGIRNGNAGENARTIGIRMLENNIRQNPEFVGTYACWEPNAFDGRDAAYRSRPGHDATGRFGPYWSRSESGKYTLDPLLEYEDQSTYDNGVRKGEYYLKPRELNRECAIDPYPYLIQGRSTWITSLVAPIRIEDRFVGMAGIDLRLDSIQKLVEREDQALYSNAGVVAVITGNGIIAAVSDRPELVGQHFMEWRQSGWRECISQIQRREASIGEIGGHFRVVRSFDIGQSQPPWAVVVEIPRQIAVAEVTDMAGRLDRQGTIALGWQILVGLLVTAGGLLAIWLVSRSLARPIQQMSGVAVSIAAGDLQQAAGKLGGIEAAPGSGTTAVRDELSILAGSFRQMVGRLNQLIGEVQRSGIQVATSATEIAASARQLESTVTEQAAATNQVSASSREILSSTRSLAQTIDEVAAVSSDTTGLAEKGHHRLGEMSAGMNRLMEATASISGRLSAISQKADSIGGIIGTINKVADQTNLLSLNAAIEAEKAGESGLGFAVVAREIRRLADQTAAATLDIEEMIKGMRSAVSTGVMEMDKFVDQVRHGSHEVQEVSSGLNEIITQVGALAPKFQQVNEAMRIQCLQAEQISTAMSQVDSAAGQTKSSAVEFARVAQQLSGSARGLSAEILNFKVDG